MSVYHGRQIRIPEPKPGYINSAAGKIGELAYAGWEDWYIITVDGLYYARERASTIEHALIPIPTEPLKLALVGLLASILDHTEVGHAVDLDVVVKDLIRKYDLTELMEQHRV